jgi:hypothetical protein
MTVNKRNGWLLWAVLAASTAARAQDGNGDPAVPGDPGIDCRTACDIAFKEAVQPCIAADGTIDEACAAGARQTHEACLQNCGPIEPPPPPPPDCMAICDAAFREALTACGGANGIVDEDCFAAARQVQDACLQNCGPIEPPPPPDCVGLCDEAFRQALAGCGGANNVLDEQCVAGAKQAFEACLQACGPVEPPPPPDCTIGCDLALLQAIAGCADENGFLDEACIEGAKRAHESCIQICGPIDPPPPPGPDCAIACNASFQQGLLQCVSPDGTIDQACAARVGAIYEDCLRRCNVAPDPQQQCLLGCDLRFQETVSRCARADGTVDEECLAGASAAHEECVKACGVTVPGDVLCGMLCEAALFAALEKCAGDPALGANEIDAECAQAAQASFDACLASCGIRVPEEIACASRCDVALKEGLLGCGEDFECQGRVFAGYDECLRGCGFAVPDLPSPDPCLSACDKAYGEAAAACFDASSGEPDQECLAAVDQRYLACLEGCGVLPGPLPPGDDGCLGHCDEAYRKELGACGDPATNTLDPECLQAADRVLADCLQSCGMGLPEDLPGAPAEDCSARCNEELQGSLRGCIRADGTLDPACADEVAKRIEACMGNCEDDAQARVLAALARTAGSTFLRGDANRDRRRDLSDAVAILSFLFTGGARPPCADAADANDDGTLNITDPVVILDFLFRGSGPLPAPADEPGTDPTADALTCTSA